MLRSLRGSWLPAYSADFRKRLSRLLARALRGLPASLALSTLVNDNVSVDKPGKIYTCKYGYIRNIPASCYVLSAARGSRPIARTSGRDCRVSWRERYDACLPHWLCPHWSTIMSALTSTGKIYTCKYGYIRNIPASCYVLSAARGSRPIARTSERLSRLWREALRGLPASLALSTLVNDNVSVDKPGKIYTCKYGLYKEHSCIMLRSLRGSWLPAYSADFRKDCRVSWRERYEACLPHWLCPHWSTIMSALTSLEHSCIMLRSLRGSWLPAYSADFRKRLSRLLARALRGLPASLALSTLVNDNVSVDKPVLSKQLIEQHLSGHDLSRLEAYCRQQADYRLITDLLAPLANVVFHTKTSIKLDAIQQVLFIAMGFQMKDVDDIATELGLPGSQILAKFYEACKKINNSLNAVLEDTVAKEIGIEDKNVEDVEMGPVKQSLQDELSKAAKELERKQRKELSRLMGEDLAQYRIKGSDLDWGQALAGTKAKQLVSVKSGEKRLGDDSKEIDDLIEAHSQKKKKKKKHVRNQV
ncbi:unnamed protein product [Chrysodeixis includens]|uniref:Possible tRNA binding domain-containing protein n=1 Tax=Chrysodeixis includens TaxID=689277 RepID=A0A9N8Q257_CHRIL|nr:unnamed protein product [Chrysodeixis includens]